MLMSDLELEPKNFGTDQAMLNQFTPKMLSTRTVLAITTKIPENNDFCVFGYFTQNQF